MTPSEPPAPPGLGSPADWTPAQLHHVETELLKEYPNLSRHIIHMAVILAKASVDVTHGTVRLLAFARKNLGSSASTSGASCEFPAGFPISA